MDDVGYVYALFDRREPDVIRYVGSTKQDPLTRASQHVHGRKGAGLRVWLGALDDLPGVRVLWTGEVDALARMEKLYISESVKAGIPLVNGVCRGVCGICGAEKPAGVACPRYKEHPARVAWRSGYCARNRDKWSERQRQAREEGIGSAKCEHCGDVFVLKYDGGRFCSRACSARWRAANIVPTAEQRERHRLAVTAAQRRPDVKAAKEQRMRVRGAGVTKTPKGRWKARFQAGRKNLHLGCFDTYEEALAARTAAELQHWGPP